MFDTCNDCRSKYIKFLDWFFIGLVLLFPFERAFVSARGEGAFLQYFFIFFFILSLPVWQQYYRCWSKPIIAYAIFLTIGTVSDFRTLSTVPILSLLSAELRIWIVLYVMIVAYNMSRRSEMCYKRFIGALVIMSLMVACMHTLGIGAVEFEERGIEGARVAVMGANLNSTARDVGIFIFYAFLVVVNGIKHGLLFKFLMVALSVVSLWSLLRTGSRGGVLAVACALPFVYFTAKNLSKKALYALMITCALVAIFFAVLQTPMLLDRLDKARYGGDTGGRERFFYTILYLWGDAKMLGYGSFGYKFVLGPAAYFGEQLASHCTYTYALISTGLCGCGFYYGFLVSMVYEAVKIRFLAYGNLLFLCLIMALLGGITMNVEYTKWLYIVYGLIMGRYSNFKSEKRVIPNVRWYIQM